MFHFKPPLPFMGSKIAMLKRVKEVLHSMAFTQAIRKDTIFYDVFGGSGLLSHYIKQLYPQNEVIWNDFDNFKERLDNIEKTENLRFRLHNLCKDYSTKIKLPQEIIDKIKQILEQEQYLDLTTLSSYLCFAGNYATTKEQLFNNIKYHRIPAKPLNAKGYLRGVMRVSKDFKQLLEEIPQEEKDKQQAFLILDPPYLQTQKGNYRDFYTLKDFCLLVENIFKPYLFFSSKNSDILPFIDFYKKYNPVFQDYKIDKASLKIGGEDYMICSSTQTGLFDSL